MKKGLKILMALAVVMPFAKVEARKVEILNCPVSQNCWTYKVGETVNFYRNKAEADEGREDAGISTVILEDKGASSQYVKGFSFMPAQTTSVYYDSNIDAANEGNFKKYNSRTEMNSYIEEAPTGYPLLSIKKEDDNENVLDSTLITLDEVKNVFGAKDNGDGTYSIDAQQWGRKFGEMFGAVVAGDPELANRRNGFYTSTEEGEYVWVVKIEWSDETIDADVTKITVEKVLKDNSNEYMFVPVLYYDKSYECITRTIETESCYICGEDYSWLIDGSEQSKACKKADDITTKAKCVKPEKTGIEDHLVELMVLVLGCGAILLVAKRKELFRSL